MSADLKAEVWVKAAIGAYEEEVGIPVVGNAVLDEQFEYLRRIYLLRATLGEVKFSKILPRA